MTVTRLPNNRLRVPFVDIAPDGTIADGVREIGPGDPEYGNWLDWMARTAGIVPQRVELDEQPPAAAPGTPGPPGPAPGHP